MKTQDEFKVKAGLHQGSALSPLLFTMMMNRLTDEVRQKSLRTMMFAEDIVIYNGRTEHVEDHLEM